MSGSIDIAPAMARLHAACFDAAWPETAFAALLSQGGVWALTEVDGFILLRVAADEAEILTLAVEPTARRIGVGSRLLDQALSRAARQGATRAFLEVAADNIAAQRLYASAGFSEVGRRSSYYARLGSPPIDALLLARDLASPLP